jgi:hypothetical protein
MLGLALIGAFVMFADSVRAGPESLGDVPTAGVRAAKPVLYDALPIQYRPNRTILFPEAVFIRTTAVTNFCWRAEISTKRLIEDWAGLRGNRPSPLLPKGN